MQLFPLTLFIDVKQLTRALGLQDTGESAVFVVTPAGETLARVMGRYSETGAPEISSALSSDR